MLGEGGDNSCTDSTGKWKMGGKWELFLLYAPSFPNTFWKVKCRSVLEWMLGRGISVWSTIGMVIFQMSQITHKWILTLYLSSHRYYNKIPVLSKCKGFFFTHKVLKHFYEFMVCWLHSLWSSWGSMSWQTACHITNLLMVEKWRGWTRVPLPVKACSQWQQDHSRSLLLKVLPPFGQSWAKSWQMDSCQF